MSEGGAVTWHFWICEVIIANCYWPMHKIVKGPDNVFCHMRELFPKNSNWDCNSKFFFLSNMTKTVFFEQEYGHSSLGNKKGALLILCKAKSMIYIFL